LRTINLVAAFLLYSSLILFGSFGISKIENISLMEGFHLVVSIVTTVGYADLSLKTNAGKFFSDILMLFGTVVNFYMIVTIVGLVFEGGMISFIRKRRMERRMKNMKGHIVVCGYENETDIVIEELLKKKVDFILITEKKENIDKLKKKGVFVIEEPVNDESLEKANISKAKAIICILPRDSDAVFVTLTAKSLNPDIRVIVRANEEDTQKKLYSIGADVIVLPSVIGGRRLAKAAVDPLVIDFLDVVTGMKYGEAEIYEMKVTKNSEIVGKSIFESGIRQKSNAIILAIKRGERFIMNPNPETKLIENDVLIMLGKRNSNAEEIG